jgi:hypothetical protein
MPKQHAVLVTLVRLAAAKVIAKIARVVFIKTTYVKQNALNVHRENRTSMPKQHAVLVSKGMQWHLFHARENTQQ